MPGWTLREWLFCTAVLTLCLLLPVLAAARVYP